MMALPPTDIEPNPIQRIADSCPGKLSEYLDLFHPVDSKGRYLHYDELQYRIPKGLDLHLVWSFVKLARKMQQKSLLFLGEPAKNCSFYLTPAIQKAISETDRHATTASLEWMCSKIGEQLYVKYLLNDLIEDEAISSSQLEGAATTTKTAKELLKHQRKPRTPDEKMILGNFKMMRFAWENRHKSLSNEIIASLHKVGVEDIDDSKYRPGVFRTSNDVEVVDGEGNTVHIPPSFESLGKRLQNLCDWANEDHHDVESQDYIHPLIKAIVLHFTIGFEHPFHDGNGRVARALFYWYMFKNDFAAFRYIAISVLLKSAPAKYGRSYLFSESDEMDLTYFINYQCGIISRAISEFKRLHKKALHDTEEFNTWLWSSDLYKQLSDKQRTVFQVAKNGVAPAFTVANVQDNLGCSYNTAAKVLNGLVDLRLFAKKKQGKTWVYAMRPKREIQSSWSR